MPNEQIRVLYQELRDIKQLVGEIEQRIDQLEQIFAAALHDAPLASVESLVSAQTLNITTPPADSGAGPSLVMLGPAAGPDAEELYPNGIDAVSGRPLLKINAAAVAQLGQDEKERIDLDLKDLHGQKVASYVHSLRLRQERSGQARDDEPPLDVAVQASRDVDKKELEVLGTIADIDQNSIGEARWAVVVHAQEDVAVLQALWPLIRHRMGQMGYEKLDFDFQSGDTSCAAWLNRHTDNGKKTLKGGQREGDWRAIQIGRA
ncbi:MAG: hypothetical protein HGA65_07100, partial [Oscillochloris sp.]|nr:hypothetical protein [Oscillochloris sp.]